MPASFGLVPELTNRIRDKRLRYKAYQERSMEALNGFKKLLDSVLKKITYLSKVFRMKSLKVPKLRLNKGISMQLLAQE